MSEAAAILLAAPDTSQTDFAPLFADDVVAYLNGDTIARGKPAWLALHREQIGKFHRRVRGYSAAGELLIVDEVDPAFDIPTAHADPRWTTRATLYQFGPDHLIRAVRIVQANGFFRLPSSRERQ